MKEPRRTPLSRPLRVLGALLLLSAVAVYAAALPKQTVRRTSRHNASENAESMAENSRDAGLLTDWHLLGRYGHSAADFASHYAPERWAAEAAAKPDSERQAETSNRHFHNLRYELLFPDGTFALPPALAGRGGVFYAISHVYLSDGGEWNLYLESGAEAEVYFDGSRVLANGAADRGALRESLQAERGEHLVMVKFVARSAPFRVAILPPDSGSRRKNSTPYLNREEDLNAALRGRHARKRPVSFDQTASSKVSTLRRSAFSANFSLNRLSVAKTWLARWT